MRVALEEYVLEAQNGLLLSTTFPLTPHMIATSVELSPYRRSPVASILSILFRAKDLYGGPPPQLRL